MTQYASRPAPTRAVHDTATARLIKVLSMRWTIPVSTGIAEGHPRFNELQRYLSGISHKVLTDTLRTLRTEGFVAGPNDAGTQTGEYRLTDNGRELLGLVEYLRQWAERYERG